VEDKQTTANGKSSRIAGCLEGLPDLAVEPRSPQWSITILHRRSNDDMIKLSRGVVRTKVAEHIGNPFDLVISDCTRRLAQHRSDDALNLYDVPSLGHRNTVRAFPRNCNLQWESLKCSRITILKMS
jgi:hypothetical protein